EKREFCEAVKAKRFDLITYFRRLREITAKYSAMVLIAYIKDNHDFLNERCNKCGLGVTIHYKFSFTPPSIPSPTVPELAALELDDELTRHHVRRELGFKSWEQVKTWLSGEDTRPLIEKLKEVSAILETIDYFRHPRSDLNTLELSLGSLQAFANSIMDIIRELEQEVQNRPKIYLNLVEEYSHTVAPKGPMQTSG
ncbi:MAG: hypothetical protein H3Z53_01095, partial [archaeon]|nr:hypothetical protein [archaeon]